MSAATSGPTHRVRSPTEAATALATWSGPWQSIADLCAWPQPATNPALNAILAQLAAELQPSSRHSAQALADGAAVAVIAGQQPAVGGGPLFCLSKAAQACAVAAAMTAAGQRAIPVFWVASEDHDLDEGDHADCLDRNGQRQRFHHHLPHRGASWQFQPAESWFTALNQHLETHSPWHNGAAWWQAEAKPLADENTGAWLARLLMLLFEPWGLWAVEAATLRPCWQDLAPNDLWPASRLAERRTQLVAAQWDDTLGDLSQPPLFADRSTRRLAVDNWRTVAPAERSAGASLRPILQQLALPGAVYLAGPGELRYTHRLAPVYEAFGATPPRFVPRAQACLLPPRLARVAKDWGLDHDGCAAIAAGQTVESIVPGWQELADPQLQAALLPLQQAQRDLQQLPTHDPDLAARQHGILRQLKQLEQRWQASLHRHERRRHGRRPLGHVGAWLRPGGQPQERVLSLAQALWMTGPHLAAKMVAQLTEFPAAATPQLLWPQERR